MFDVKLGGTSFLPYPRELPNIWLETCHFFAYISLIWKFIRGLKIFKNLIFHRKLILSQTTTCKSTLSLQCILVLQWLNIYTKMPEALSLRKAGWVRWGIKSVLHCSSYFVGIYFMYLLICYLKFNRYLRKFWKLSSLWSFLPIFLRRSVYFLSELCTINSFYSQKESSYELTVWVPFVWVALFTLVYFRNFHPLRTVVFI